MARAVKAVVWRERLRRYEQSRLTVVEFCHREGVSVPSFYHWRRRLVLSATGDAPSPAVSPQGFEAGPAFAQVTLASSPVVAVELPSGVRIELPAGQMPLVRAVVADLIEAEAAGRGEG
jgi:hypothetical protein